MELFSALNISKQFSGHRALDKVSISIPEGSIFGLLGPNGAGKTTFIRIINQIIAPDEGQLFFNGRELKPNDIYSIGYLPEERGLYKKMTVGEQSMYLAQLKGLSKHEARKRLLFWFEKFEMRSWWNKKVEELSKGMQQKVQFLITIIHEPKLLIFDEPFSGFDPINASMLRDEIIAQRDNGATVIFSTHNMASVEELCDHIALINNAKVVLDGPVRNIKRNYRTNTFKISYNSYDGSLETILPSEYIITSECVDHDLRMASIRIPIGAGPNQLISTLLPNVSLHSFSELIPSMNDIFIRVVTEKNSEPVLQV
jgi:ABC-2 type transport system ATP-binding protein